MLRVFNIALLMVVAGVAAWTYQVKHEADKKLALIRQLERDISRERETIELLRADWAHLSNPGRLQGLAETYAEELQLEPVTTDQIIDLSELPPPPVFDPGDAVGDIIAGDVDAGVATGSIAATAANGGQ